MGLLDTIIKAQSSGPRILSEQHDVSQINWVNGLSDPGEMISCGYLPQARRQSGESDSDYRNRIQVIIDALPADQRAKIMSRGQKAAIVRASLDVTNGKVSLVVAGENSWHQLGTHVDKAMTSADAMRLSGLDGWQVCKVPAHYMDDKARDMVSEETFILYRSDTGKQVGTTGRVYQPCQNGEMFAFLDEVLGKFGAKYSSAGAVHGGRQVFLTVEIPEKAFTVNGNDAVLPRAVFLGDHSGTRANRCFPTAHRPVCANTTALALREDGVKGISIRHSGRIKDAIADAQEALHLAVDEFDHFHEAAEHMTQTKCEIGTYANNVLDLVLGKTQEKQSLMSQLLAANKEHEAKSLEKEIKRRGEILSDIVERYHSSTNGVNGMRGTTWSAYNAVTEHVNHNSIGRQVGTAEDRQSRRMESVLQGAGAAMSAAAYQVAMAV